MLTGAGCFAYSRALGRWPPPVRAAATLSAPGLLGEVPVFGQEGVERVEGDVVQLGAVRLDRPPVGNPEERKLLSAEGAVLGEHRQAAVRVRLVDQAVHRRVGVATRVGAGSGLEQ